MDINSLKDNSYRDSSFGLVRTNPLITGNIKLTVDSNNALWLNSIDANNILAQNMFKRFAINTTRSYPSNVKTFFNQKNISTEVVFDVYKGVDPSKVSHDYKDQYDFSFYFAGAKYLNSVQYSEKFSYFAPLHVNNCDIPEYFVIFKIPGALNDNIKILDENRDKYNNTKYMFDILKKATIIKTYSMKVGTVLGDYLRNKVFKDSLFPSVPLNVNFNRNEPTTWYGLNIKTGVYCGMGEYLYDFYKSEHTLKDFEYYITCGYKRNGLLYPNILNMEFLFNDETSEIFDHNRYFGLYINSADIERFSIDFDLLKSKQDDYGNLPKIYNVIDEFDKKQIYLSNENGVVVEGSPVAKNDKVCENLNIKEDSQRIVYLKDKRDNLHSISIFDEVKNIKKINFIEKDINAKMFSGSDEIVDLSGNGIVPLQNGRSCMSFRLESVPKGEDKLFIYYRGGSCVDESGERYDVINFKDGFGDDKIYGKVGEYYTNIQNYDLISLDSEYRGDFCGYYDFSKPLDSSDFDGNNYYIIDEISDTDFYSTPDGLTYSENGNEISIGNSISAKSYIGYAIQKRGEGFYFIKEPSVVSNASNYYSVGVSGIKFDMPRFMDTLVSCINEFPLKSFSVFHNNNDLIIVCNSDYSSDGDVKIKFVSESTKYSYIGDYDKESGMIKSFGATEMNNILLVPNDYEPQIMKNFNGDRDYLIRSKSGYSKIKNVVHYASFFRKGLSKEDLESAYDIFKNYVAIVLEKDELPVISASKFEITKVYRPSIGLCSFYKVKDFDFDYYSTSYSAVPEYEYNGKIFVLPDTDMLNNMTIYLVLNGTITYNGVPFKDRQFFVSYGTKSYSANSGDPFVIPVATFMSDDLDVYGKIAKSFYDGDSYRCPGFSIKKIEYDIFYDEFSTSPVKDIIGRVSTFFNSDDTIDKISQYFTDFEEYLYYVSDSDYPLIPSPLFDESDLFTSMSGFYSIHNNAEYEGDVNSAQYIFRDRFLLSSNKCEYDVAEENYNPEYAYFSNTVGCSCKFGYMMGSDIRNNPYRLNVSSIFGTNNLSPAISDNTVIDPMLFTNEFYYIVNDYKGDNFINSQVFDWNKNTGDITINKNFDFIRDLTYRDSKNGNVIYRYSDIKYNSISGKCQSFFKGILMDFLEVDENGVTIEKSRKYDGYKFTVVLQAFPELTDDNLGALKPPFEYVVKTDESNKTIIFGIILYLGDLYRATFIPQTYQIASNQGHPVGTYEYRYMENEEIKNYISTNFYEVSSNYNGDYRFSRTNSEYDEPYVPYIGNITSFDLYNYKSKKYFNGANSYSHINVSIPSKLDIVDKIITAFNSITDDVEVSNNMVLSNINDAYKKYYHQFGYDCEMSDKFFDNPVMYRPDVKIKSVYGIVYDNKSGIEYLSNSRASFLNVSEKNLNPMASYSSKATKTWSVDSTTGIYMRDFRQAFSGAYYYDRIFRNITFNGICNLVSKGFEQYDNSSLKIAFCDASYIEKNEKLTNEIISDGSIIGYSNSIENTEFPYKLQRMHGSYSPIFTDVIFFDSKDAYNDTFMTDVNGFGDIKNFGYLKISDEGSDIFKYENSDTHDLKYPYIGECTVDHSDMNILHTSWDVDFHKKYTSSKDFEYVYGTMRREEDDTYINNLINLPSVVELSKFDVSVVDDISVLDSSEYQVAYNSNYIEKRTVFGSISVEDVMVNRLIELGIYKSFADIIVEGDQKKYTESEIDDYVRSYIKINVLPLYEVKSVTSYYRINNDIERFSVSSEDYNRYSGNIKVNKDVKINKTGEQFKIDFSFPVNYDKNVELFFDIKLKLI